MSQTPQQNTPQELARLIANVARVGTIHDVRTQAPARCRVAVGENVTGWLPWITSRAGGTNGAQWWAPAKGEQCLLISSGGDLAQGVVLLGIYSDANPAPANRADVARTQWSREEYTQYAPEGLQTRHRNEVRFEVGEDCSITMRRNEIVLRAGNAVLQVGPSDVRSTVDIRAQNVSLMHHVHGGVESGHSKTTGPL